MHRGQRSTAVRPGLIGKTALSGRFVTLRGSVISAILRRIEHANLQRVLYLLQRFQRLRAVGFIDINHHVTDLIVGLQILARNVDAVF